MPTGRATIGDTGIEVPFTGPDDPAPSAQSLYDWAVQRLAALPQQPKECAYRIPDPVVPACIVGHLITDEEHRITQAQRDNVTDWNDDLDRPTCSIPVDASTWDDLTEPSVYEVVGCGLMPDRLEPHARLLSDLQILSDNDAFWLEGRKPMVMELIRLAAKHGLDASRVPAVFAGHGHGL